MIIPSPGKMGPPILGVDCATVKILAQIQTQSRVAFILHYSPTPNDVTGPLVKVQIFQ
jgi:hypothetical protein